MNPAHPLYDLLHKKARYKVYWGGRGASKSWGIAEALIRKAAYSSILVLCAREYQNSLADSSHKMLVSTIKRLGMESWFTWTASSITSRSGAEFIFKGLHNNSSSSIRSTEDIDICWVEEAQSVSALSWRALTPTIRKPGAEIWVSYNLMDENDATHQRFVNEDGTKKRRNSIVHKINYDQNPYLSDELREEMEDDKALDYELYEHIWLGMPQKRSNAIIFGGRYRVAEFDRDEVIGQAWMQRQFYGNDFGFADDPLTLTRSVITEGAGIDRAGRKRDDIRKLWVLNAKFGKHVELDDMPEFYDAVPGSRDWPIKADNARPETISHLRNKGFNISAAEKWPGSVEDGIAHLKGFDEIIIHSDLKDMAREAYMYRYKVDKNAVDERGQPLVLPVVVDKFNHGWDGIRYSLDGYIQRSGELGLWARLGRPN